MALVALKRIRVGETHLGPGDVVPEDDIENRNVNVMIRMGLVADLETKEADEEAHTRQVAGHKARITVLEKELEEAHSEIAELRAKLTEHAPQSLEELGKGALLEMAKERGIEVPSRANKGDIVALLSAEPSSD